PILVVTPVPDDVALRAAMNSLGARAVSRELVARSPAELAVAITAALDSAPGVTAELRQARRIFAAGQAALSLQHAINNPLAVLRLAERRAAIQSPAPREPTTLLAARARVASIPPHSVDSALRVHTGFRAVPAARFARCRAALAHKLDPRFPQVAVSPMVGRA